MSRTYSMGFIFLFTFLLATQSFCVLFLSSTPFFSCAYSFIYSVLFECFSFHLPSLFACFFFHLLSYTVCVLFLSSTQSIHIVFSPNFLLICTVFSSCFSFIYPVLPLLFFHLLRPSACFSAICSLHLVKSIYPLLPPILMA